MGLLAKLVPNAKFCYRPVIERTLPTILMKQYQTGTNAYAYSVDDTFTEIDLVSCMISDWHQRLPDISAVLEYEELALKILPLFIGS